MSEGNGNGFAGRGDLFKPYVREFEAKEIAHVGCCRFRSWTEGDRRKWEQRAVNKKGETIPARQAEQRLAMIAYSMCDGDGNLVLSEDDIRSGVMLDIPSKAIAQMAECVMTLTGLFEDDVEDGDAVKNSEATHTD